MNELTETLINNEPGEETENDIVNKSILIRHTRQDDGRKIWELVKKSHVLDINSVYCYLLMCTHFRNTCLVAEVDGEPVGFVTSYHHPDNNGVLFIWQTAVDEIYRGKGIAKKLILELLNQKDCRHVTRIQATVSPSNKPSRSLFESLAKNLDVDLTEQEYFDSSLFPDNKHEEENLITVGPFNK